MSFLLGLTPLFVVTTFEEPFADPKWVWLGLCCGLLLVFQHRVLLFKFNTSSVFALLLLVFISFNLFNQPLTSDSLLDFALVSLFLILWSVSHTIFNRAFFWSGLYLSAFLISVLVLLQVAGVSLGFLSAQASDGKWQAFATLGNPNRVGWFLTLVLLNLLTSANLPGKKIYFLFLSLALFLTFSRGAWLALAIGWICFNHYIRPQKIAKKNGTTIWIGAIILIYLLLAQNHNSLLNIKSIWGRIISWQEAFSFFLQNPHAGIGLGKFAALSHFMKIEANTHPVFRVEHIHNEYLGILIELGWIGFALGCATLYYGLPKIKRSYSQLPLVLVGLPVMALYDFPLREPSILLIAMVELLALRSTYQTSNHFLPFAWRTQISNRLWVGCGGILIIVSAYQYAYKHNKNWDKLLHSRNYELRKVLQEVP